MRGMSHRTRNPNEPPSPSDHMSLGRIMPHHTSQSSVGQKRSLDEQRGRMGGYGPSREMGSREMEFSRSRARYMPETMSTGGRSAQRTEALTEQQPETPVPPLRMERKRSLEKLRRQEINERLEELTQVLQQVEIPPCRTDRGRGASSSSSALEEERQVDKSKESHRVQLLQRAIKCLKNLRFSYDSRTAELMKLYLKMQQYSSDTVSAGSTVADNKSVSRELRPAGRNREPHQSYLDAYNFAEPSQEMRATNDYERVMMMIPIWLPKGSVPPAPQYVPHDLTATQDPINNPPPPSSSLGSSQGPRVSRSSEVTQSQSQHGYSPVDANLRRGGQVQPVYSSNHHQGPDVHDVAPPPPHHSRAAQAHHPWMVSSLRPPPTGPEFCNIRQV